MYQIERIKEVPDKSGELWVKLEEVGPQFGKGSGVLDYALATIPPADWWGHQVRHMYGESDAYGVQDSETEDLEDFVNERKSN